MAAIDAYFLDTGLVKVLPSLANIGEDLAGNFSTLMQKYAEIDAPFPQMTAGQIANCSTEWYQVMGVLFGYEKALSSGYKDVLTYFDARPNATFAETESHLLQNTFCAKAAVERWFELIQTPSLSLDDAFVKINAFIDDMFEQGKCSPQI